MDIETALERADEWAGGHKFHARAEGWRPAVAVLAGEVRRLRAQVAELEYQNQHLRRASESSHETRDAVMIENDLLRRGIGEIGLRFISGNSIPVERTTITLSDYEAWLKRMGLNSEASDEI